MTEGLFDVAQLPACRTEFCAPRRADVCVIVPVLNEGSRIVRQLEQMRTVPASFDTVIVDGGSSDGAVNPVGLKALGVRALLVKMGPGRLSAQLRLGLHFMLCENYPFAILIDGNNKDDVQAIPAFIARLRAGDDYVQGSRYMPGGRHAHTPWDRQWAVRLVHAPLISCAARRRYTDTTNGFRGVSARFLRDARVRPLRAVFDAYNLHFYLAIRAARLGFAVSEIPVTRSYPLHGPPPSKIGGVRGKAALLLQSLRAAVGAYNP